MNTEEPKISQSAGDIHAEYAKLEKDSHLGHTQIANDTTDIVAKLADISEQLATFAAGSKKQEEQTVEQEKKYDESPIGCFDYLFVGESNDDWEDATCPICGLTKEPRYAGNIKVVAKNKRSESITRYRCCSCGEFEFDNSLNGFEFDNSSRSKLQMAICEATNARGKLIRVDENWGNLLNGLYIPVSTEQSIDKFLSFIDRLTEHQIKSKRTSENIISDNTICWINTINYPICCENEYQFERIICFAHEAEYVKFFSKKYSEYTEVGYREINQHILGNFSVRLTYKGKQRIGQAENSNKAFVAMWYPKKDEDNQVLGLYDKVIKSAVDEATGGKLNVVILNKEEYNTNINDKIIYELKTCRFCIADFTGGRGGVYYEAGFARGEGREVIFMCREDWFDKDEQHKVHFDINHENFIIWEHTEKEGYVTCNNHRPLKEAIADRIRATFPALCDNNGGERPYS